MRKIDATILTSLACANFLLSQSASAFAPNSFSTEARNVPQESYRKLAHIPLFLGSSSNLPQFARNEFSRTVKPDSVIKHGRRSDYSTEVTATKEECDGLAKRFDLSNIASLQASLSLRPENIGGERALNTGGIEVEGTCRATVTQRCVRTNEDFQVDLEFPLYCIVRPVTPISQLMAEQEAKRRELEDLFNDSPKQKRNNKKTNYRPQDRNVDEMDMMELQRMLQQDISDEDDVLMEDESIYSTNGPLDIGELVAQLFWFKLDPYPKKPGTDPVQRSITG